MDIFTEIEVGKIVRDIREECKERYKRELKVNKYRAKKHIKKLIADI